MTFAGVIEALKSGKRVTRKQWGATVWMAVFEDHFIQVASGQPSYNYDLREALRKELIIEPDGGIGFELCR
jgi:hypothetical protein